MIPWSLYNLTPRDQAGPLIRPFFRTETVTGAGVTFLVMTTQNVPEEQILLVTHLHVSNLTTVAAQWNTDVEVRSKNAVLRGKYNFRKDPSAFTFTQTVDVVGSPLMMLNPGDRIQTTALSGVAGNQTTTQTIHGILIPRGTISLT